MLQIADIALTSLADEVAFRCFRPYERIQLMADPRFRVLTGKVRLAIARKGRSIPTTKTESQVRTMPTLNLSQSDVAYMSCSVAEIHANVNQYLASRPFVLQYSGSPWDIYRGDDLGDDYEAEFYVTAPEVKTPGVDITEPIRAPAYLVYNLFVAPNTPERAVIEAGRDFLRIRGTYKGLRSSLVKYDEKSMLGKIFSRTSRSRILGNIVYYDELLRRAHEEYMQKVMALT